MSQRNPAALLVVILTALFAADVQAQFGETVQQFAQIAVGGGAVTSFVIHNPGTQEIDVAIDLYRSDGSSLSSSQRHLLAGATMTVQTESTDPQISAGWAKLSSMGRFTATEFFELTVGGQKLPMVGVLPCATATRARLFTFLSPGGTNTGLAIANPSSSSANLTVRLLAADGTEAGSQTLTLGAQQHRAQFINEGLLFPSLTQFEGTVEVQSTVAVIMLGLRTDAAGLTTVAAMMPSSTTLVDGSIQTQHLADSAVTTAKLADGAVTSAKIAGNAVTTAQLADSSVGSAKIIDGSIGPQDLADAAITTAKIAGNAVTTAQLADSSVGSAKIIDGSIGPQDLADAAVTKAKLSATGGTSGQVLGTDGTSLAWQTVSGGGGGGTLSLPFSGGASTAASTDVFYLANSGAGRAIQGKSVSDTAIFGLSTSGVGVIGQSTSNDGVVGRSTAPGKSGVWGTGAAGVTGMGSSSDGVLGVTTSTYTGDAGVHGRNAGPGLAVFSEGNLYVTGAFLGNIGSSSGAPFPRPAYDSGWVQVPAHSCPFEAGVHHHFPVSVGLDTGLPTSQYDSQKFVVDLQTRDSHGSPSNLKVGSDEEDEEVYYYIGSDNSVTVYVGDCAENIQYVRVRVWVYR